VPPRWQRTLGAGVLADRNGRYPVTDCGDAGPAEVPESGRRAAMLCGRLHAVCWRRLRVESAVAYDRNKSSQKVSMRERPLMAVQQT